MNFQSAACLWFHCFVLVKTSACGSMPFPVRKCLSTRWCCNASILRHSAALESHAIIVAELRALCILIPVSEGRRNFRFQWQGIFAYVNSNEQWSFCHWYGLADLTVKWEVLTISVHDMWTLKAGLSPFLSPYHFLTLNELVMYYIEVEIFMCVPV